jgi:acetyl-CoA acyltransferase
VSWSSEALILDAVRSPIGRRDGTLSTIRGDELAAQVLNGLVARHELDPAEVEDVQMGCVTQVGEQGWNIGRMVPMVAGWPETVAGTTVDRQCGSSMQGNFNAAAAVWSGQLDLVVSAGVEMMSRVPMGSNGGDLSDKLLDRWQIVPQGISAEVIA